MSINYYDAAVESPSGCPAGVYLPFGNIGGLIAGELGDEVAANTKLNKTINGLLTAIYTKVEALSSKLGMSVSAGTFNGIEGNIVRKTLTFGLSYLSDLSNKTVGMIPLAVSGTNAGAGKIAVADIFPNAVIVAAGDAVSGEGIIIPFADIDDFGGPATLSNIATGQDNRAWIFGLIRYLYSITPVRATNQTSAFSSKSKGTLTPFSVTDAMIASSNPTTGLTSALLVYSDVFTQPLSFTIEYLEDLMNQTREVRIV